MKRTSPAFGMQRLYRYFLMNAVQPVSIFFGGVGCCAVLALFLFSCSRAPFILQETPTGKQNAFPLSYSVIFIIHGDGEYLYHDSLGKAHKADEATLAGAMRVAIQNSQAEVFIFHQIPRKQTLFVFPHRDGKFYYYRYGKLLAKESYWRNGASRFDPEVALYHRYCAEDQSQRIQMLLYFGHEIPEYDSAGYDASSPDRIFTVDDLSIGLKQLTSDSTKFDLVVLSTCFNGTPYSIATLAPVAKTIVASPDNLHLSYFDLHPFERLDVGLHDGNVAAFAKKYAFQTFDRLAGQLQTTVTVSVYNVDHVQQYLHASDNLYNHALTKLEGDRSGVVEHCDCAEDSAYVLTGMSEGVDVFYRPPQFGRLKHKQNHSGWGCYKFLK